jgi:hypothetical protein
MIYSNTKRATFERQHYYSFDLKGFSLGRSWRRRDEVATDQASDA